MDEREWKTRLSSRGRHHVGTHKSDQRSSGRELEKRGLGRYPLRLGATKPTLPHTTNGLWKLATDVAYPGPDPALGGETGCHRPDPGTRGNRRESDSLPFGFSDK